MKSNAEFTQAVLKKVNGKKRKKRRIWASVILCSVAICCFLIGFSNIVTFDVSPFKNSYAGYLKSYVSTGEEMGLRIVDEKNAVVRLNDAAYPCQSEATAENKFTLTVIEEERAANDSAPAPTQETPSVFRVEFWDTTATVSWKIHGVTVEKILNVTEEKEIPAGLWSLFAIGDGTSAPLNPVLGAGWTLIEENGDSYTGEGMDSAHRTKFVSVGNNLLQCMFDPISGLLLDASVVTYDETAFDYPVLIERYLSDGDTAYFYSRLLQKSDQLDFSGGSFTTAAITYESENHFVKKEEIIDETVADWSPFSKSSQDLHEMDVSATLELSETGEVELQVLGSNGIKAAFYGRWHTLKHSVLVVLDKKCPLTGRVFTLYVGGNSQAPSGELLQRYAQSRIESLDCYKVGYHTFHYYIYESETVLYWGSEWTKDCYKPRIEYETEYVLYGKYFKDYYDGDWSESEVYNPEFQFDPSWLVELPVNGAIFIFHEDGTLNVTFPDGRTDHDEFELSNDGSVIYLRWGIDLHVSERAINPNNPWRPNRNLIVSATGFQVEVTGLYQKHGMSYGWTDEETGKSMLKSVVRYELRLEKKK